MTPSHLAASQGYLEVLKILFDKGATHTATDGNDGTPLHEAALAGHLPVVQFLIDKGANVNALALKWRDRTVETPLSYALSSHTQAAKSIAMLLIKAGAQLDAVAEGWLEWLSRFRRMSGSGSGRCSKPQWDKAFNMGGEDMVKLLIEKGAVVNLNNLKDVAFDGDLGAMKLLLARCGDAGGWTLLHAAASSPDLNEVSRLVKSGADVNVATREEAITPLSMAARFGRVNNVRFLLEQGADVNRHESPLWAYIERIRDNSNQAREQIVQLLLDAGANHRVCSKEGTKIFSYLSFGNCKDLIWLLLKSGVVLERNAYDELRRCNRDSLFVASICGEENEVMHHVLSILQDDALPDVQSQNRVSESFMCVMAQGHLQIAERLLEILTVRGWLTSQVISQSLNAAVRGGHPACVALLAPVIVSREDASINGIQSGLTLVKEALAKWQMSAQEKQHYIQIKRLLDVVSVALCIENDASAEKRSRFIGLLPPEMLRIVMLYFVGSAAAQIAHIKKP